MSAVAIVDARVLTMDDERRDLERATVLVEDGEIVAVGSNVEIPVGSRVIEVSSTSLMLAVMISLAVGIDYALFIVSRHRDQLSQGLDPEESAARAVATATPCAAKKASR